MGHEREGAAAIGQDHILEKGFQIVDVIGDPADMTQAALVQEPNRAALPAPVERRDGITEIVEIGHRLEILLDRLVATLQEDDGAAGTGLPAGRNCGAQPFLVGGREIEEADVGRRRIVVDRGKSVGRKGLVHRHRAPRSLKSRFRPRQAATVPLCKAGRPIRSKVEVTYR